MADPTDGTLLRRKATTSNLTPLRKDRILALEIRFSKFGFVVFDGPTKLLDWKVRSYAGRSALRRAILEKRIHSLLDLYTPSTVVMRRRDSSSRKMRKTL